MVAASGKAINRNIWEGSVTILDLLEHTTFSNTAPYTPEQIPQEVVINGGINDAPYIHQAANDADRKARETAFAEAYAQFLRTIAEKYGGSNDPVLHGYDG